MCSGMYGSLLGSWFSKIGDLDNRSSYKDRHKSQQDLPFVHEVAEPKSRQTLPHHQLKQGNTHRDTSLAGMMDDYWRRCLAERVFYPLPQEWLAMMKRTSLLIRVKTDHTN